MEDKVKKTKAKEPEVSDEESQSFQDLTSASDFADADEEMIEDEEFWEVREDQNHI